MSGFLSVAGWTAWLGMDRHVQPPKGAQDEQRRGVLTKGLSVCLALTIFSALLSHFVYHDYSGELAQVCIVWDVLALILALKLAAGLTYLYFVGLDTRFKVTLILALLVWIFAASMVGSLVPYYLWGIVVLDGALVLQTERDSCIMNSISSTVMLAIFSCAGVHVFCTLNLSSQGADPSSFLFKNEEALARYPDFVTWLAVAVPIALNFLFVRNSRREVDDLSKTVALATDVARKLADYDLAGVEELLATASLDDGLHQPLLQLQRNLQSYRNFLPNELFAGSFFAEDVPSPNMKLEVAMQGQSTSWEVAQRIVSRLRDPSYTLPDFQTDLEFAFPEFELLAIGENVGRNSKKFSSGLEGEEELMRTMGALFSLYCCFRLDMDGKRIFSYGIDVDGRPKSEPSGEGALKKMEFYEAMPWDTIVELFVRADLMYKDFHGNLQLREDRVMAFLVLTVVHDVMKNTELLPVVQKQHAPYRDICANETIHDHDVAIAYVMEKFPWLLPSFYGLEPKQCAPILFTQSKMGFNNGWLVQGEAPPGLLFSRFKQVIVQGRASERDVSFYFAHWLTDLAGAELYTDGQWPGAEKFTIKFPMKVLQAFLNSFAFVGHLANCSEVEVMESYLHFRWAALGPPLETVASGGELAAMRIALMAQGFEKEAVTAFEALPDEQRHILVTELARTGHTIPFEAAPQEVRGDLAGPTIFIYYAPALLQKAGRTEIREGLLLLASVFRAARQMFPLESTTEAAESVATIRIDALKVHSPQEAAADPWCLVRTSQMDAKASNATSITPAPSRTGAFPGAGDEVRIEWPLHIRKESAFSSTLNV